MTPFTLAFTAQSQHIDELGHVNNAVWVQWIQDIATAHWGSIAPEEMHQRYIWMVTRHEIDYRGNIALGESVTGRTWISEPPRGARFNRNVAFDNAQGKTIVQAVTSWALLDRQTQKLLRVREDITGLFGVNA
ncbi:acyl-CoA thioesterase [Alterisphingorhabdus coralli]|uniref:Acyl-CoA thioesterase n=1 Tax=Alterisphingorhabdus coralli TaxID=3071408 RepID=A0AA97F878_9SPHN|nr:acyl-CoA thioesterase [Parasphingorhabdus sp. SCSIO 66989]WOE75291.1 acyl-CoA thioesterase [Parasphingorhabdus sp. SCSIO 66989]